jgi:hypothetical protein
MAAAKKITKKAAYAAYEKTESKATKKMELKKGESKAEKARETKVGMAMMMKKKGKK